MSRQKSVEHTDGAAILDHTFRLELGEFRLEDVVQRNAAISLCFRQLDCVQFFTSDCRGLYTILPLPARQSGADRGDGRARNVCASSYSLGKR